MSHDLDAEARRLRLAAILDAERAAGYSAAFRSGVARIVMFAAWLAGDRGLTRDHVLALRTAVAGLMSDMDRDAPWAVRDELRAYAKDETERALERLGARKSRARASDHAACCYADVMTGAAHDADCDGVQKPVTDAPGGETP